MVEKTAKPGNSGEPLATGFPLNVEAYFDINQKFYRMMTSCNDELMSFGRNRLKEDLDMPQKLAECKTPQDVMNVYFGFYQTALKQYADEAGELTRICTEMTSSAPESFKPTGD
jgi:hypothetical protein